MGAGTVKKVQADSLVRKMVAGGYSDAVRRRFERATRGLFDGAAVPRPRKDASVK